MTDTINKGKAKGTSYDYPIYASLEDAVNSVKESTKHRAAYPDCEPGAASVLFDLNRIAKVDCRNVAAAGGDSIGIRNIGKVLKSIKDPTQKAALRAKAQEMLAKFMSEAGVSEEDLDSEDSEEGEDEDAES